MCDWSRIMEEPTHYIDEKLVENNFNIEEIQEIFSKISSEQLSKIPWLNNTAVETLAPGSLVRFQCMVQDIFDPELFLACCETRSGNVLSKTCGYFRDGLIQQESDELLLDSSNNITRDRQTLYCVSIPASTPWYNDLLRHDTPLGLVNSNRAEKRALDDDEDIREVRNRESKRSTMCDKPPKSTDNKRAFPQVELNRPLPEDSGPCCLVRIYNDFDKVKVNDVIEVLGVYTVRPAQADLDSDGDSDEAEMLVAERKSQNPPPSMVARIHALTLKQVSSKMQLDLIPDVVNADTTLALDRLRSAIRCCVCDDRVAADFVMCSMFSQIMSRSDLLPVGKMSLNLSNIKAGSGIPQNLASIIANVLTQCHYRALTVPWLEAVRLEPEKDYEKNRLSAGELQLADHTYLIVDETALQPGTLTEKGLRNLQALATVCRWQRVSYDFKFHQQDFNVDVPVLWCSEGKAMITCQDFEVPVSGAESRQASENLDQVRTLLSPEVLWTLRRHFLNCRHAEYSMQGGLEEVIQEDFVRMRQESSHVSADSLHSLLTLARYLAYANGETSLSQEVWFKAQSMELERKTRVASRPTRTSSNQNEI